MAQTRGSMVRKAVLAFSSSVKTSSDTTSEAAIR